MGIRIRKDGFNSMEAVFETYNEKINEIYVMIQVH
jgi:hypothetical protein